MMWDIDQLKPLSATVVLFLNLFLAPIGESSESIKNHSSWDL